MRIGVTCYPTVGGSGILGTRLGVEFAKRGHPVHFITYERPVAIQAVDPENVRVHLVSVVEYPLFKYPPFTIALATEMSKVTESCELDLLHVHYSIPHSTAAYLSREKTGKPYVCTLHGSDVTILGSDPAYKAINSFTVDRADVVTSVSRFMAERAKELGIQKDIHVIPNFVDTDIFLPAPCDLFTPDEKPAITIAHVSNFRPVKRIDDLVYAMCIAVKQAPDLKLMLIGDGPERHKIEQLINHLDLNDNITMTGYRRDIPNLLRCADALVLCSQTESAPLTLLEAMSCGLPVIATEVGGIPEIVDHGRDGFLVEVKHPEAIAERILELNADQKKRLRLGAAGRRKVLENYTIDTVIDQYMDVYKSIA